MLAACKWQYIQIVIVAGKHACVKRMLTNCKLHALAGFEYNRLLWADGTKHLGCIPTGHYRGFLITAAV